MLKVDTDDIKELREKCSETPRKRVPKVKKNVNSKNENDDIIERLKSWFIGFFISLVAIFFVPLFCVISGTNIEGSFARAFSSASVTFLGISFTVTAMYDHFITYKGKGMKFPWVHVTLILFGAMLYVTVAAAYEIRSGFNSDLSIWLNSIFLGIVLLKSIVQYFSVRGRASQGGK